jgi:glutamine---fructose-6-phosphate transaminase (isomerizing)
MCGIVGYVGERDSVDVIVNGLKRLEYRGYDSSGIAVISDNRLNLRRMVGKVSALSDCIAKRPIEGKIGIGHTRWATHGRPSEENAHPHTDCKREIVVIHNGIVENYLSVRENLKKLKHKFKSETDTEVIAHLIEEKIKRISKTEKNKEQIFLQAVLQATSELEGAYALGILWAGCPDAIIGVKKQSPLVVGVGDGEGFLGSDVPAFLDYTKRVYFLEDGEIALIKKDEVKLFNARGQQINRPETDIKWDFKTAEKAGYDHFMLKEINEQPNAIEDTLRGRLLPIGKDTLKSEFGISEGYAKKLKRIFIAACGTANHASMVAKYVLEEMVGLPVTVDIASEFRYRAMPIEPNTLFIAVSQSGETADTLAALKRAKELGMKTLAICNVLGSTLTREADFTFYTHCGPEIGVASTKAFVGQLVSFYIFALHLAVVKNKMTRTSGKKFASSLMKIPGLMRHTLKLQSQLKNLAKDIYNKGHYIYLGRNVNFPIALEGALKLKEISYVYAEGFAGGEMKHGPIAMIEEGIPVIGIAVKSKISDKMLSNLKEVNARGAFVIGIVNEKLNINSSQMDVSIKIPEVDEILSPILSVIPLQIFAYYVSVLKGCDVDQPRNLAKSVTVE